MITNLPKLTSLEFQKNLMGYESSLYLINYNGTTAYNAINELTEFLGYMQEKSIDSINKITSKEVISFFDYLQGRANFRNRSIGLDNKTINKYINSLKLYNKIYALPNRLPVIPMPISYLKVNRKEIEILSIEQVQLLFQTAEDSSDRHNRLIDLAILGILYGGGLRRREIEFLNLDDILPEQNMIKVIHGKGYKERLVPVHFSMMQFITDYINYSRDENLADINDSALFASRGGSRWGLRLSGQSIYGRMKSLAVKAGIEKNVYPHLFRHSIATHMVIKGMKLNDIKAFLGHDSIESTQRYLHLAEQFTETNNEENSG
jgi:integrase/recombinase XerD